MAYSLGDPYRSLRLIMRVNGVLIGIAFGVLFLVLPSSRLNATGLLAGESPVAIRIAGAALVTCGLFLVLGAQARAIDFPLIVPTVVFHFLLAIVLLVAYLRQQLAGLGATGQVALLIVFLLCLAGALVPLRYFRAEYRF